MTSSSCKSAESPIFALQKALQNSFQVLHCPPCKSQKYKRPLKVTKFSYNLFLLCVWLYCDLLFYSYILNFSKSSSIIGSAIFGTTEYKIVVNKPLWLDWRLSVHMPLYDCPLCPWGCNHGSLGASRNDLFVSADLWFDGSVCLFNGITLSVELSYEMANVFSPSQCP